MCAPLPLLPRISTFLHFTTGIQGEERVTVDVFPYAAQRTVKSSTSDVFLHVTRGMKRVLFPENPSKVEVARAKREPHTCSIKDKTDFKKLPSCLFLVGAIYSPAVQIGCQMSHFWPKNVSKVR